MQPSKDVTSYTKASVFKFGAGCVLTSRRLLDDRLLDRIGRRPPSRRSARRPRPVERLPADPHHTRDGRGGEAARRYCRGSDTASDPAASFQ
jgi:hypothetical protein